MKTPSEGRNYKKRSLQFKIKVIEEAKLSRFLKTLDSCTKKLQTPLKVKYGGRKVSNWHILCISIVYCQIKSCEQSSYYIMNNLLKVYVTNQLISKQSTNKE